MATIASAVELGRINAFTADYSRAKVAAAKIFDLLDRESTIDPLAPDGKEPVSLSVTNTYLELLPTSCRSICVPM